MKTNKKQFFSAIGVCFFATFLGTILTFNLTFLKSLENDAKDIRIAALQPAEEQSKEIIIVTITEETLECFLIALH